MVKKYDPNSPWEPPEIKGMKEVSVVVRAPTTKKRTKNYDERQALLHKVAELRKVGHSLAEVAEIINKDRSVVSKMQKEAIKTGLIKPEEVKKQTVLLGQKIGQKPQTLEFDKKVLDLYKKGTGYPEMAKILNSTRARISHAVMRLRRAGDLAGVENLERMPKV